VDQRHIGIMRSTFGRCRERARAPGRRPWGDLCRPT